LIFGFSELWKTQVGFRASAMASRRAVPIVVGVGDIKNRSQKVEDAIEPVQLMLQATLKAIQDTGLSASAAKEFQSKIDSVGVVNTWTWSYSDLPGLISEKLGVKSKYKVLSHHGGDSPTKLFDEAARRISFGESKVSIVTGGEALASSKYTALQCGIR
jgi:acetyl-CoA acetyltransferase